MSNYQQVISFVRGLIESGEYPPGSKLPSTSQIAGRLGVSISLVNNAMRSLEERGEVIGRKGLGRFVPGDHNGESHARESA